MTEHFFETKVLINVLIINWFPFLISDIRLFYLERLKMTKEALSYCTIL